ncbi:MAG: non-ribosomal peptide synthetase, partial [bacterium]|nr:non-ribosomal peptide synthetase [bacterium]
IWAGVLGKDKIGIDDNFFANGGDSIKSIQIMSRMNSAGYKLEMKDLFQYPAISQLTPYVKELGTDRSPVTEPKGFMYRELDKERLEQLRETYREIEDIYILSPMQEGMLFHALADSSASTYFQQTAFSLSGDLDIPLVEISLNQMLKRHDVLRTAFVHKDTPRPLQVVLKERTVDFSFRDVSHIASREEKEAFVREFIANDT